MKIAFDHQIFTAQEYGGISRYFFELASHLTQIDGELVESCINSPVYINEYLRNSKSNVKIIGNPGPVFHGSKPIYHIINRMMSSYFLRGWHPDIIHETYYSKYSNASKDSRIVITIYDMIHELYPDYFSSHDPTRENKKVAVDRADHIICISENTRQDLIHLLNVPPEKTTVVHLGFTLTHTKQDTLFVQNRPFILYVGKRNGYKNFDRLLTAYASRKEIRDHYDLVAFGGGAFSKHESNTITHLNLNATQVRHVGGDDRMLATLYKQANMFIYPSLYEGFGIPPLEAMSFDCPVICSNSSSIPEVVGDAALMFDPLEAEALADAIVLLGSDLEMQQELTKRGRERVKNFSWHKCAMQTLDVYRKVLA